MKYSNSPIVYIENHEMRYSCAFLLYLDFKKKCYEFTISLLSLLIHNIHVYYYIKIQINAVVGVKS